VKSGRLERGLVMDSAARPERKHGHGRTRNDPEAMRIDALVMDAQAESREYGAYLDARLRGDDAKNL
jgi:hypothetical protein